MQAFAQLVTRLPLATSPVAGLTLLADYLAKTPDPDRGYALAILTGALPLPRARPALRRQLLEGRLDAQLVALSKAFVGDLIETVALTWPVRPGSNRPPDLSDVVTGLASTPRDELAGRLESWLDALEAEGRWATLKLANGGFRPLISSDLAREAVARLARPPFDIETAGQIDEIWHGLAPPYEDVFAWLEGRGERPVPEITGGFRPVMRADTLDPDTQLPDLNPTDYAVEWKWDGIRVQVVREGGKARIYGDSGEDLSATFPDLLSALSFEGVIDGELLATDGTALGSSIDVQRRRLRSARGKPTAEAQPIVFRAYDLLVHGTDDLRRLSFRERRRRLEMVLSTQDRTWIDLSPTLSFDQPATLEALRNTPLPGAPQMTDGLILKRWDSPYKAGRPRGQWLTWTREPHQIKAVLLYARRSAGHRGGTGSELSFGVWASGHLITVGNVEVRLDKVQRQRLDRLVRDQTVETFGPVRRLRAEPDQGLVLQVSFEGVLPSTRHKSGLSLRNPQLHDILWDSLPEEADSLDHLERLLSPGTAPR